MTIRYYVVECGQSGKRLAMGIYPTSEPKLDVSFTDIEWKGEACGFESFYEQRRLIDFDTADASAFPAPKSTL